MKYDNIQPILDPRVAEMIKTVTDQMEPKGSTETRAEREHRQYLESREARHRSRRRLRVLATEHTIEWLNKKPRR